MTRTPREMNLAEWERALSVAVGVGLVVRAFTRRRVAIGEAITGVSLVARGAAGYCPVSAVTGMGSRRDDDTRQALGGSGGSKVEASITIQAPVQAVFDAWRDPLMLPRFMAHVERVDAVQPGVTRWTLAGPAGLRFQWDAETINEIAPWLLAWRSLPGADIVSAGSIRFTEDGGRGTEVRVSMQYDPPAGKVGTLVSWLVGHRPAAELRGDLRRLKQILEAGEVATVDGQSAGRRTRLFKALKQRMA